MDPETDRLVELTLVPMFPLDEAEVGTRKIPLKVGQRVIVGRSSSTRPDAAAAPDNAMIDSPVVSRSHGYFINSGTPDRSGTLPAVFLVDENSMHGTMVNSERLAKQVARAVHSHDRILFGVDVTRGDKVINAKEFLCRIAPGRSDESAAHSASATLRLPSDDGKILENEAHPSEEVTENRSPSPDSDVYEYNYDDGCGYNTELSSDSDDEMSSVGSFSSDSGNGEDDIGFNFHDHSNGSEENDNVTYADEAFKGQLVHEEPPPSTRPETAGARRSEPETLRHMFFEQDARSFSGAWGHDRMIPVPLPSGIAQRNAREVSPEPSQWDQAFAVEEPTIRSQSFDVGLQPARGCWRREGMQVFPMPLPTPTLSDTNAGIEAEHAGHLFNTKEASPPLSPVKPKEDEVSTSMPKSEEETRPSSLTRKVSYDRMMISSVVDSATNVDAISIYGPAIYGPASEYEKTEMTGTLLHSETLRYPSLEVPPPAQESEAMTGQGLKRKLDDMADDDTTTAALALSSLTSETKAALQYTLNSPESAELKETEAVAANIKDIPSPAVKSTNNAPVERPTKRLRTVLGYAGTVAASVAVGAIAVIGGLTALPEGFFE